MRSNSKNTDDAVRENRVVSRRFVRFATTALVAGGLSAAGWALAAGSVLVPRHLRAERRAVAKTMKLDAGP